MKKSNNAVADCLSIKPYALVICEQGPLDHSLSDDKDTACDYADSLNTALTSYFDISAVVRNGADIWPALLSRIPDVIIISRTFPQIDPITLTRCLRLSRYCFDIRYFLICEKLTDSIRSICVNNDIDEILLLSEPVVKASERVHEKYLEFLERKEQESLNRLQNYIDDVLFFNDGLFDKHIMNSITSTVLEPIGLDPKHKGTYYLQLIICMKVLGIEADLSSLYSYTGQLVKASPSSVEKAVRYSIERAWEKSSPYIQYFLFGNTVDESRGKPTNSEFVATTVQHVREMLQNNHFKYCD